MIPFIFFCFISAIPLAVAFPGPVIPGVGFGLTADYGTAAIFLLNDTEVKLAKIEGSPEYKSFMRREYLLPPDTRFCRLLGTCPRKQDFDAASAMIAALKSSAEAYFGTSFCFANLAIPDEHNSYHTEILDAAMMAHSLGQSSPTLSAGKHAVIANIPWDIELPDEQLVLAVDYSRSGLNLDLFCDDIGVVDGLVVQHEPGIGADNPGHAHWADVIAALEKIARPPFPRCPMGHEIKDRIDYLVFYGDSIADRDLSPL